MGAPGTAAMIEALRDGSWVTAQRLRVYPLIVLVLYGLALVVGLATSHGWMDAMNRPLGTDFSQVWTAGVEVLEHHPEAAYDPGTHAAKQRALFGADTQFYGWHYPPYFLAIATLLALLPYGVALLVWQGTTLPLYLASVIAILAPARLSTAGVLLAACAFPAVFVNLTHGHNGFLTAALLAGGLLALPRRAVLAGVLFACLAYKPQFALVLPVALLASGAWRTIASGLLTLSAITLATIAAFGTGSWLAFRDSLDFTRTVVLEQGNTGWAKIQSTFAAARMLGASIDVAYVAQGLVTLSVLLVVAMVWRSRADMRLKAALLMVATLLTTPYCLDYDMMALGPALAFALAYALDKGFRPWEKTLFVAVWAVPAVAREVAMATDVPLGVLVMLAFFVHLSRRALSDGPQPAVVWRWSTLRAC